MTEHYDVDSLVAEVRSPQSPSFSNFRDQGNTPKPKKFLMSRMIKDECSKPMPPLEPLDFSARVYKQESLSPSAKLHPKKRPRTDSQTFIDAKYFPASPPNTPVSRCKFDDNDEAKAKIWPSDFLLADKEREHLALGYCSPSSPSSAYRYGSPSNGVLIDTPRSLSAFSRVSSRSSIEDGNLSEGGTLKKRKRSRSPETRHTKLSSSEGTTALKPFPDTYALDLTTSPQMKPEDESAFIQARFLQQQQATLNIINLANPSRFLAYSLGQPHSLAHNPVRPHSSGQLGVTYPSSQHRGVAHPSSQLREAAFPPSGQLREAACPPCGKHQSLTHQSSQAEGLTSLVGQSRGVVHLSGQRKSVVYPTGHRGGAANLTGHRGVGYSSGQPRDAIYPAREPVSVTSPWGQARGSVQTFRHYQGGFNPSDQTQGGSHPPSQTEGHHVLGRQLRDGQQIELYGMSATVRDGSVPRVSKEQVDPSAGLLSNSDSDRSRLLHYKLNSFTSLPNSTQLITATG
ncbi:hypothetical protein Hamer_G012332 [Homarus americanus]|uniref:Uncharacterized protein n=2 Tax=Homarus americanus TaxID=6706 RepID=A0A8J5KEN3_HOMAM|nr:hypothetical protein Hamer_G012332 [Homarus americanus]